MCTKWRQAVESDWCNSPIHFVQLLSITLSPPNTHSSATGYFSVGLKLTSSTNPFYKDNWFSSLIPSSTRFPVLISLYVSLLLLIFCYVPAQQAKLKLSTLQHTFYIHCCAVSHVVMYHCNILCIKDWMTQQWIYKYMYTAWYCIIIHSEECINMDRKIAQSSPVGCSTSHILYHTSHISQLAQNKYNKKKHSDSYLKNFATPQLK